MDLALSDSKFHGVALFTLSNSVLMAILYPIFQSDFDCEPIESTYSQTGVEHSFPVSLIETPDHIACLRVPRDGTPCKKPVWLSSDSKASTTSDFYPDGAPM